MGDLREWSPEPTGGVVDDKVTMLMMQQQDVAFVKLGDYCWERAEEATQEIISHVQPTLSSEKRRTQVIDYVQSLIRDRLGCEVFPFGSVPLKTYLPDGDIDLTVFGRLDVEDTLALSVCNVLENEDQFRAAKFEIKDVQLIRAEVKLVKCLIQNIVVDISFNQLGGLSTLCFLEKVDRLIGRDNLFKRSIILIKAWCYYESRILGAHHGLISTYALETLVLYIFHLFHSSLGGPLAVLYKFLDYFSKFDWDNYCISLSGPIRISSLPEIVVEAPENGGGDMLLSDEFLRECSDLFSVPARVSETISRTFLHKYLNIMDPLKDNNNLGRSVSKGNFYRIQSAFTYGARKLGRILSGSKESLAAEIPKFFSDTLVRHGKGERPDVQDPVPLSDHCRIGLASPLSEKYEEYGAVPELDSASQRDTSEECTSASLKSLTRELNKPVAEMKFDGTVNDLRDSLAELASSNLCSGYDCHIHKNGTVVSDDCLSGDAKDQAKSKTEGLSISGNTVNSPSSKSQETRFSSPRAHHAPHLYFSQSNGDSRKSRYVSPDHKLPLNSGFDVGVDSVISHQMTDKEMGAAVNCHQEEHLVDSREIPTPSESGEVLFVSRQNPCSVDEFDLAYGEGASVPVPGSPGNPNLLTNLRGDYEGHFRSLQCSRSWYEYAFQPMPLQIPSPVQGNIRWSAHWQNIFPPAGANANCVVPGPAFYPAMNPSMIPAAAFGVEEKAKPRGTGTYFPNTNHYRDRPSSARGRNHAQTRSPRSNGRAAMHLETNFNETGSHEMSSPRFTMQPGGGKPRSLEHSYPDSPGRKPHAYANGSVPSLEKGPEFGSHGHAPVNSPSQASSRHAHADAPFSPNSNSHVPAPGVQRSKPISLINQDGIILKSFRLKDEEDFPPLSS